MITEPSLIILDEPTSGLDSHISLEVMRVVRSLSNDGRTVICNKTWRKSLNDTVLKLSAPAMTPSEKPIPGWGANGGA